MYVIMYIQPNICIYIYICTIIDKISYMKSDIYIYNHEYTYIYIIIYVIIYTALFSIIYIIKKKNHVYHHLYNHISNQIFILKKYLHLYIFI